MSLGIRRAIFSFLFFISLYLSPPLASAEVTVEVELGFHGFFNIGHPFPLTVILTNLGGPIEGVLQVEVAKGGPSKVMAAYPFFHTKEIFLAAQSHRRVQFTVNPDSMAQPLKVTFVAPGVKVSGDFDLRGHFSPSPLILLVTGSSGLLSIPLAGDARVPVVSLSIDELPSNTRAYQGVWAILLYEQSLRDLSGVQRLALERWLSAGGRILILGGVHYALYQEAALEAFLPVRVTGLKELTTLPNLERRYGPGLPSPGTFLVQDSMVKEGQVLLEEEGTPILVEMNRGKGKVIYLSLDVGRPPFSQWKGLPRLFSDLLGEPGIKRPSPWASWNDYVFARFLSDSALFKAGIPIFPFLMILLLYGGGLSLLVWLWLKQKRSRPTLSLVFLLFVVFLTVGGYLYFDRGTQRMDGLLLSFNLLEVHPGGYAEVQSNVGVFTTRRRNISLHMERGWSDLEMVQPIKAKAEVPSVVIRDGIRSTVLSFQSREWHYRLFRVRSVRRFPLAIKANRRNNRISLKLSNLSGKDLTQCWLVYFGRAYPLGDIPKWSEPVHQLTISADGKSVEGLGKGISLPDIPFKGKGRKALFRHSLFSESQASVRWSESGTVIVGWVEGESPGVWVDDNSLVAYSYSLFRAALPLDEEEEL